VHEHYRNQPKTMKELVIITTRNASGEEGIRDVFVQGDGRVVPSGSRGAPLKAIDKGANRSTKCNKRGPKQRPQWATVTNRYEEGDNEQEADDSNEDLIAIVTCDFKRHACQPADHFVKLLEVTCPNHVYSIRHKLKECSMMKNYMTKGTFAKGKKSEGDLAGKVIAHFPEEKAVMSIYGGPAPHKS
jgi:hypothetical protein